MAIETVSAHEVRKLYRWAHENLPKEQRSVFEARLIECLGQLATTGTTPVSEEEAFWDDNY